MSDYLIITGLSGAGRSTAAATFEDLGWFVIDNMPPALITKVAELVSVPGSETEKVALVVGRGGTEYLDDVEPALEALRSTGNRVRMLFLDASDDVLVRRFEGTRRRHPLAAEGVIGSITQERRMLDPILAQADVVVDTSDLDIHQLRGRLIDLFERDDHATGLQITVVSFGFKHRVPLDVDLVFDCRFLPNPHWVEELRPRTGGHPARHTPLRRRHHGDRLGGRRRGLERPAPRGLRGAATGRPAQVPGRPQRPIGVVEGLRAPLRRWRAGGPRPGQPRHRRPGRLHGQLPLRGGRSRAPGRGG